MPPASPNIRRSITRFTQKLVVLLACLGNCAVALSAPDPSETITDVVQALDAKTFDDQLKAAERLSEMDHPRVQDILTAMVDGDLATLKDSGEVVIAKRTDDGFVISDPISGDSRGDVGRRDLRKLRLNNALRTSLRELIARNALSAADSDKRFAAVAQMMGAQDQLTVSLLRNRLASESDSRVRAAIEDALALADLYSGTASLQLTAMDRLSGNVHSSVRAGLIAISESTEVDQELRQRAVATLRGIERRLEFYGLAELVFFGLSLGSVLVLAAIGLAITFGVMGVINMAHGELIMLGAYTTYVVQMLVPVDVSLFVAIPAAFLIAGLVGIGIERGVIRFLYGRPLETLLATFGISLVLQQLVRSVFSPLNRSVITPDWMSGSFELVPGLAFTFNRLFILAFSLMVFFALLTVLQRTRLGLEVRAVAQNRQMARALGVRSAWVDSMTFGLGSGIAGVAGVALSQLTNVGPNLGQSYIVDCFMVVVFGGVGNIWGTLVGGLSLGIANKFLEPFAGAVVAKILVLVFIILFIQKRPSGLFPQKGRAAEG